MAKKRASRKPSGINDNINDFLDRREVKKYGQRIDRTYNEAAYMPGDLSKALRAKMAADRFVRSRVSETKTPALRRGPVEDLMGNPLRPSSKPMQGSAKMRNQNPPVVYPKAPVKASPISGRTVEYGTRSMLQGLRNWIAGGGGSRLTGR